MSSRKAFLTVSLLTGFGSFSPVQAALTSYTVNNQNVVYSSISDITWTNDANLLGTMMNNQGYTKVVNAIIAASPMISDTPNIYDTPANSGSHTISASDFSSTYLGRANWFGGKAFANYLNSIDYAGSNQWTLPTAGSNPLPGFNQLGGQFGQLFYSELGGSAGHIIPNTSSFTNESPGDYWLGTEYTPLFKQAWMFNTSSGYQYSWNKNDAVAMSYLWVVSPGQISAVPIPNAIWLFGSGLTMLMGVQRSRSSFRFSTTAR